MFNKYVLKAICVCPYFRITKRGIGLRIMHHVIRKTNREDIVYALPVTYEKEKKMKTIIQ